MNRDSDGTAGQRQNLFERNPRKTLIITAVFFILVADVLARVVFNPTGNSFRCSSPYYHHDFLPNQDTVTAWGNRKYRMFTNSLGFRDGMVREVPLATSRERILLMGDSFIEGMGVSFEQSVAGILGNALNPEKAEVLNAAAVSYSPKLHYLKLRYLLEQKHLVFTDLYLFLDISDPHDEIIYKYWDPPASGAFASGLNALDNFLQKHFFLYSYVAAKRRLNRQKAVSNAFPAEGSADAQFWVQDLQEYVRRAEPEKDRFLWPNKPAAFEEWGREGLTLCSRYIQEIQKLCDQHGIRLSLVIYPSPYQLTRSNLSGIPVTYWSKFAEMRGIRFLNLFPAFIADEPPEAVYGKYFIPGDIHWNEAGNRLVADAVLQHIREHSR